MTRKAVIEYGDEVTLAEHFIAVEKVEGDVRVYYDASAPIGSWDDVEGPTDNGLYYQEYPGGEIAGVYINDTDDDREAGADNIVF